MSDDRDPHHWPDWPSGRRRRLVAGAVGFALGFAAALVLVAL